MHVSSQNAKPKIHNKHLHYTYHKIMYYVFENQSGKLNNMLGNPSNVNTVLSGYLIFPIVLKFLSQLCEVSKLPCTKLKDLFCYDPRHNFHANNSPSATTKLSMLTISHRSCAIRGFRCFPKKKIWIK